jgi:hypothetical protein
VTRRTNADRAARIPCGHSHALVIHLLLGTINYPDQQKSLQPDFKTKNHAIYPFKQPDITMPQHPISVLNSSLPRRLGERPA